MPLAGPEPCRSHRAPRTEITPSFPTAPPPPGSLRVLIVFHEPDLLGAGISVLRVLDDLRGLGWTPSGWFPGAGPLVGEAAETLATHAMHAKPIAYSARGWKARPGAPERLRQTPGYLRAFRSTLLRFRPHVVHANTLRTLPEASVARAAGLPVVLHVHELPPPGAKRALAVRWASEVADVLVGVSSAVTQMLKGQTRATPVVTARNGIAAPSASTGDSRQGTVGTVGTVSRTKGTDVFLRAAKIALERRPDLRFEHVGQADLDPDADFAREVAQLAQSPALEPAVAMLGRRPFNGALGRWEMFVLPSRQDAFPLSSLEAMAAGLPVIAADVGGLPEQIVHLESGVLVPPDDAAALADWIVRLHDDREQRRRLGAAAAKRVQTMFTLAEQAHQLHTAYLAALNLRHGPPSVRRATLEAL